jgi:hypothetical protein
VRHFGTKLGTPKPAVFGLEAATSVRESTLLAPMMRTSFASTSTRWASACAVGPPAKLAAWNVPARDRLDIACRHAEF